MRRVRHPLRKAKKATAISCEELQIREERCLKMRAASVKFTCPVCSTNMTAVLQKIRWKKFAVVVDETDARDCSILIIGELTAY